MPVTYHIHVLGCVCAVKLNANRTVVGVLRGFDQFMNLVLDNTVEVSGDEKNEIGMVVSHGMPSEARTVAGHSCVCLQMSLSTSRTAVGDQRIHGDVIANLQAGIVTVQYAADIHWLCAGIGTVSSRPCVLRSLWMSPLLLVQVIRGNSVVMIEALESIR